MNLNPLRIAVAGLGTVGGALITLIEKNGQIMALRSGRPLTIVGISGRDKGKKRDFDVTKFNWFDDPIVMLEQTKPEVVVELIGGAEGKALELVTKALASGVSVVTANKALLAAHGRKLAELAEQTGAQLFFEAAVAGGIPIIKNVREALAGNEIRRVVGIMNGTSNYILSKMSHEKLSFNDALKQAQEKGYAEADPTLDINGMDAAHKLALLTTLAFGQVVNMADIYVEGIESIEISDFIYAASLGQRIKLLAIAERIGDKIIQRVHPALVSSNSALANIDGPMNAIQVETDQAGCLLFTGAGAGGSATASAVAADLVDFARGHKALVFGQPVASLHAAQSNSMQERQGAYYVRLTVVNKPGVLAAISKAFADASVSLASAMEREYHGPHQDGRVTGILTTEITSERNFDQAMTEIMGLLTVVEKPRFIRIESV